MVIGDLVSPANHCLPKVQLKLKWSPVLGWEHWEACYRDLGLSPEHCLVPSVVSWPWLLLPCYLCCHHWGELCYTCFLLLWGLPGSLAVFCTVLKWCCCRTRAVLQLLRAAVPEVLLCHGARCRASTFMVQLTSRLPLPASLLPALCQPVVG